MGVASRPASRDYPQLFRAMNDVLRVLATGGKAEEALRQSFESAARGFAAQKALLLLVKEAGPPLRLQSLYHHGLEDTQVAACERGESIEGVSPSRIRSVAENRRPLLIKNPAAELEPYDTPALLGQPFSVLCAPVVDPVRQTVLAVMYFQNDGSDRERAYTSGDLEWLEGYASALGHTFAFYFEERRRAEALGELLQGEDRPPNAPDLVGDSPETLALRRLLHEVFIPAVDSPDPEPVLLLGERGTGKDLVARYLHAYSARRDRPFVAVNCAEITDELAASRLFGHRKGAFTGAVRDEPGLFRAADRGVLLLDEVAELTPRVQATLLRVLESRTVVPVGETREARVDVQVLLTMNREPKSALAEGAIRADLLDRFRTQTIRLSPLRERPADVPELLAYFLSHHERRMRKRTLGFTPEAHRALVNYAWPGNVRELARLCSLLVAHARPGAAVDNGLIGRCDPELLKAPPNPKSALGADVELREAVKAFKRELLLSRVRRYGGDARLARESLGLPKSTFHRYLAALGIKPEDLPTGID